MSSSKKSKPRGRPPKYVLDDKGKEVVGLSYNNSNKMYYATGTNPRHYFTFGYGSYGKDEAIRQLNEWKKSSCHAAEDIEQQKYRNDVYQKAVSLFEDGHFKELIEEKARDLIENDSIVDEALCERARKLVENNETLGLAVKNKLGIQNYTEIVRIVSKKTNDVVREMINKGLFDNIVWERAYDLIEANRFEAADILGIKEIIHANAAHEIPLKFYQALMLFYHKRDEKSYLYDQEYYSIVWYKISHIIGDPFLYQIKYAELKDALETYPPIKANWMLKALFGVERTVKKERMRIKEIMDEYTKIPMVDRLKILEDVFTTVKKAGYDQADQMLKLVKMISL